MRANSSGVELQTLLKSPFYQLHFPIKTGRNWVLSALKETSKI